MGTAGTKLLKLEKTKGGSDGFVQNEGKISRGDHGNPIKEVESYQGAREKKKCLKKKDKRARKEIS